MNRILSLSAALMLTTAPAWSQDTSINHTLSSDASVSSEGNDAIPALPLDIKTQGDVSYVTGGVGDEELSMLKAKAGDFNLHLLLSAPNGDYVSGATVHVKDGAGADVLTVADAGPYVYAMLKPGNYTLEAQSKTGETKTAKVTIPTKGATNPQVRFTE